MLHYENKAIIMVFMVRGAELMTRALIAYSHCVCLYVLWEGGGSIRGKTYNTAGHPLPDRRPNFQSILKQ